MHDKATLIEDRYALLDKFCFYNYFTYLVYQAKWFWRIINPDFICMEPSWRMEKILFIKVIVYIFTS